MNLREEIRRRFSEQPPGTAESAGNLEAALEEAQRAKAELAEVQKQLEQEQRAKCQLAEALMEVQVQLAEAKAYIAELKRQLFWFQRRTLVCRTRSAAGTVGRRCSGTGEKPCAGEPRGARRRRAGQKGET